MVRSESTSLLTQPGPKQRWSHSACAKAEIERALNDIRVTAIEADVMGVRGKQVVPVMAHPTLLSDSLPDWDTTLEQFLELCVSDGRRHIKLDFKQIEAVEPSLKILKKFMPRFRATGQGIWLNADVLPGPNGRGACRLPAHLFLPLWRKHLPQAKLSLGWKTSMLGFESRFTTEDMRQMLLTCRQHGVPGHSVLFAPSIRLAQSSVPQLAELLNGLNGSQLLFWTAKFEVPVLQGVQDSLDAQFAKLSMQDRIGYDVHVLQGSTALMAAALVLAIVALCGTVRWAVTHLHVRSFERVHQSEPP